MTRRQLRTCLKDVNSIHAEFWSIPTNVPEAVEQDPGAFRKNRYRYVLPNPHSRVRLPLPPVDAAPTDDTTNGAAAIGGYINANYIRVRILHKQLNDCNL
jgi:protein tyrosine phosphatase